MIWFFFQDTTWMEANLFDGDSSENRIPFDVLDSTEAETVYKNLLNQLNAEQNRAEWVKLYLNIKKIINPNSFVQQIAKQVQLLYLQR